MNLDGHSPAIRFLIRDRDAKFSVPFDTVLRSEGIRIIRTPIQAPNATAHAERVIETIRVECLDWTLILGRRHLDHTLRIYAEHYNRQRPHRALALASPLAETLVPVPVSTHAVRRRDLLGGLVHEYHAAAASWNRGFRSPRAVAPRGARCLSSRDCSTRRSPTRRAFSCRRAGRRRPSR